jgi:hypothetical protein
MLGRPLSPAEIVDVFHDHIQPAIAEARRYQTLQALINCTQRSLLPDPAISDDERRQWETEARALEAKGVR